MSAAVGTMSSAFPPAVRRASRTRTMETMAATITLMGAGSDGSESSSSEEAAEETRNQVEPSQVGKMPHQTFPMPRCAPHEPESNDTVSCVNSSSTKPDQDCNHSNQRREILMPNGAGGAPNASQKCVEDRMSDLQISDDTKQVTSPNSGRLNPFNRDDLSEVFFDHADRDGDAHLQQCASKPTDYGEISRPVRPSSFSTDSFPEPMFNNSWERREDSRPITNAELGLAEDHFAQPEGLFGLSSVEELNLAIRSCQALIFQAPENSERRKNLVHKLVQLRLKKQEASEPVEEEPDVKQVVGHRFRRKDSKSSKHYCEKCAGVIWGVIQIWYRCTDCGFCCHAKCLNQITRTCANMKVSENPHYVLSICPEKGLASQHYRCAECRAPIAFKLGMAEPRQCDYTGSFYCELCHWNDTMAIPARILHNWDHDVFKVCRASKQFLRLMLGRPVIRINDINPMLFSFVEELNEVKKLREEILVMKRYFVSCKFALDSKLLLQLQDRQHFVDNSDMYSLQDLLDVGTDVLLNQLAKIHSSFAEHIKSDCQLCQAKGYLCELCDQQEVLFPFDNVAIVCSKCSTVLHRQCYIRRNQFCPRCERLDRRAVEHDDTLEWSTSGSFQVT